MSFVYMQNLCTAAIWFVLELRDAEALFNSDEKVLDTKASREIPKPDSITKTKNGRTFEFKDVSDLDPDMSNIEKLISEGLKDDMVKLSDQFGGKAVLFSFWIEFKLWIFFLKIQINWVTVKAYVNPIQLLAWISYCLI